MKYRNERFKVTFQGETSTCKSQSQNGPHSISKSRLSMLVIFVFFSPFLCIMCLLINRYFSFQNLVLNNKIKELFPGKR